VGIAIGRAGFCEGQFRHGERKNRSVLGPAGVEFDQHAGHFGKLFGVVACGDKISPGLFVAAGRRPARGLKKAAQDVRVHKFAVECPRTPATAKKLVDRITSWCRIFHVEEYPFA
jgi:hypothetical protein